MESKRNILIGGAWPYANSSLHLGHLAALLPGDVLARYYRENGDNVVYVSGTDCHGTPITQRAKKEGKTPKEIAEMYNDEFFKTFKDMLYVLGINVDINPLSNEEKTLVIDWQNARKNKDFEKADELRNKINELGIRL